MKSNLICHSRKGSIDDRVYVVSVQRRSDDSGWELSIKQARHKFLPMLQGEVFETEDEARSRQHALFEDKLSEGYEDIDAPGYDGPVTREELEMFWLVFEHDEDGHQASWTEQQEEPDQGNGIVVFCVDNQGFEDNFDLRVEYFAVGADGIIFKDNGNFIKVWDKFDEIQECLAECFKLADPKIKFSKS